MFKKALTFILSLAMIVGISTVTGAAANNKIMSTARSIDYAADMGIGWNLGNTFDSRGGDNNIEGWETSWGNPVTTKEFIQSIKDRGYSHIRIPFTIDTRITDNGSETPENEMRYLINEDWLNRYKEVVQWAVDADLYVMVNIHHDAWAWLGRGNDRWNGDVEAWQYRRFTDHWRQLADIFSDMPDTVMFETINEPEFRQEAGSSDDSDAQDKLNALNKAAFDIIRGSAGNEKRIIVIPTMHTNHGAKNSEPTRDFIRSLNDENIIATVHYYSEWVFSTNIGITMFDEDLLYDDDRPGFTARDAADSFYSIIDEYFLSEGIGVSVGEWGCLAYDGGSPVLQTGEEFKYYEYMQHKARENKGVSLSFWDNGSGINRNNAPDYNWQNFKLGSILEPSNTRASYSTGLDALYFSEEVTEDVEIPLTLNGNEFEGISGLTEGTDYTYDNGVITIKAEYFANTLNDMEVGYSAILLNFSEGPSWQQFLIKNQTPEYGLAYGTRSSGISIPVDFRGSHIRNIKAEQYGERVGGSQLWRPHLHNGEAFAVSYIEESTSGQLTFFGNFFSDSVLEGEVKLTILYFDGLEQELMIDVRGREGSALVTTVPAPDMSSIAQPVNIDTITYSFKVEGIKDETELKFEVIGDDWPTFVNQIPLNDDGDYTVTVDFGSSGIAGFIHLGFVHVIPDSEIIMTLNYLYINDEIRMEFENPFTMQVGSGKFNTLPHRWFAGDGMLLDDEPLHDGRKIAYSKDKEYWFEYFEGANAGETAMFMLYQGEKESEEVAEAPAETPSQTTEGAVEAVAPADENKKSNSFIVIIGISFAAVAAVGIISIVMLKKKK